MVWLVVLGNVRNSDKMFRRRKEGIEGLGGSGNVKYAVVL